MKRFVFYPFLFVLAYIGSRLGGIKDQIGFAEMVRPTIIAIIFTLISLVLLSLVLKSSHRAGFVFILFAMIMFFYGAIDSGVAKLAGTKSNILSFLVLILLLGIFYLGASNRIWKLIQFPQILTYYLNIVFIFLFLLQTTQIYAILYDLFHDKQIVDSQTQFEPHSTLKLSADTRPDIYIIILDGYGRADVLNGIYHYDDAKFLSALEQRGFYIADHAHTNYVQTKQVLGSLLNLDYISALKPTEDYFSYYHSAIEKNDVFSSLKQIGYKTVAFDTGFSFTEMQEADVYYNNYLPLNDFESYLLTGTPVDILSDVFGLKIPTFTYQAHRERVLYTFKNLRDVPTLPGPKIVFAHILSPHPPFVFDQNGQPIEPDGPYQLFDGGGPPEKKEDYWRGYRGQIAFVNGQALETVDAILQKSKTPPIILMMGDHGPASMFNNSDLQKPGCLWERTSNLEAVLLPGHFSDPRLYSFISPVNIMRLIFNLYFNSNLPMLEDKTFLSSYSEPYAQKDITSQVESKQSCSIQDTAP